MQGYKLKLLALVPATVFSCAAYAMLRLFFSISDACLLAIMGCVFGWLVFMTVIGVRSIYAEALLRRASEKMLAETCCSI